MKDSIEQLGHSPRNKRLKNIRNQVLSDDWYVLNKVTFDYQADDGRWQTQSREAYDRGNGAAVLLYNRAKRSVVLTRQFRMPTYLNGNDDGLLIETCAGLLDGDAPDDCIVKEAREETGYAIQKPQKVFESFMSPGSVMEVLHCYIAEYDDASKVGEGGGLESEHENIEVLELAFERAYQMMQSGEIKDAKTIMLLQYAKLNGLFD